MTNELDLLHIYRLAPVGPAIDMLREVGPAMRRTDATWPRGAACSYPSVDRENFYPPGVGPWSSAAERQQVIDQRDAARKVCAECPVRTACLATALARREQWGIWAGTTGKQRREVLKVIRKITGLEWVAS